MLKKPENNGDNLQLSSADAVGQIITKDKKELQTLINQGLLRLDLLEFRPDQLYRLVRDVDEDKIKFIAEQGVDFSKLNFPQIYEILLNAGQNELEFLSKKIFDFSKLNDNELFSLIDSNNQTQVKTLAKNAIDFSRLDLSKLPPYQIYDLVVNTDKSKLEFIAEIGVDFSKLTPSSIFRVSADINQDNLEFLAGQGLNFNEFESYQICEPTTGQAPWYQVDFQSSTSFACPLSSCPCFSI